MKTRKGRNAMMKPIGLLLVALLTLLGVATSGFQAAAQGKKVTVGINSLTAIYWPTYVARAKGMYAKHGLDADILLVGSPVSGVQQLIGKSIDIAHPTLYVAVNALAHGADLRLVGCIVNTLPYSMIANPKLTSVKDLVGKSVILGFRTDVQTLMWRDWVKAQGVNPDSIDQIYDPQAANRYAALANGSAWASMLNAPFDLRAQAEGFKRLLDFGPISQGYAMAVVAARPDYIAANPDAIKAYLAATREANDRLYDARTATRPSRSSPRTPSRTRRFRRRPMMISSSGKNPTIAISTCRIHFCSARSTG
jgi:ABC-type nitrate/sulfonate/bicarbonate transport system substrate-binding protein